MIVNQETIKTSELSDEFAKGCIKKLIIKKVISVYFVYKIIITLYIKYEESYSHLIFNFWVLYMKNCRRSTVGFTRI